MKTGAETKTALLRRLNIGPRLILCFGFISLAMFIGDAVLLSEFRVLRGQSERLHGVDQELILVQHAHANLMSFYERLDALAHSEDPARLAREAEPIRAALLADSRRTEDSFKRLPAEVHPDPTLLPTLEAIQAALPAQLEAITTLAGSEDWDAVRLRLAIQVRQLESTMSELVKNIDQDVSQEREQALSNIARSQERIFFIVPSTALLTLLFAGVLGLGVTRSISQPLGQLMQASKALGRGDFQYRLSPVGKDELAHLARVFNDTATTLRDLYAALSAREAYLTEAQRLSHTGSFGWNLSSGELVWSAETFRIFGFGENERPTLKMLMERTHQEDVALVQQHLERASRGSDWDLEYRLRMPDGSIKYVRSVGHATNGSTGNLEFVGTVMDLTQSKQAEHALRQTQADLAHMDRIGTIGELGTSLAHEINQPIAGVITNASTSLRWLTRDPPDLQKAREATTRIIRDAERAAEIIKNLKSFYSKSSSPTREWVDINEIAREILVLLRNEASRHSISMRADLAADVPKIEADRVQLQQVFMNLMLNGIEAMKTTSGELTVTSRTTDGGQLLIAVSDSGAGLRMENKERIFDPFFTTKPHGTGMGLAISRRIVESHGGRLWASANAERGATFYFTLGPEVSATSNSAG